MILLLAFAPACGRGKPEAPPKMVPSFVLKGSWYDIGRQTAYYYPGTIIKGAVIFRLFLGVSAQEARQYYADIESTVPGDIKEHIQGLADGLALYWHVPAGLARDMALIWNLGIEVNTKKKQVAAGCTAFAFSSPDGLFLAHNTDNRPGTGGMGTAFYYEPANGDNHYLSFFAPGFVGVGIGMNDKGLAITYNVGRPNKDARTGLPGIFMAQQVMAKCSTLAEAIAMFKGHLARGGHYAHGGLNFLLVDYKDSSMARLQVCSGDIKVTYGRQIRPGVQFEGTTNHFDDDFAPFTAADMKDLHNISSKARYKRLMELAPAFTKYDLAACWSILNDREGGEPTGNTICRRCDIAETTMTNIFTRDTAWYTLGVPCDYLARYGAPRQIPVLAPQASVTGRVTARGAGLEKARVELASLTDADVKIDTYSAPDGSYVFYNMPRGIYRVTVKKLFHIGATAEVTCGRTIPQKADFDLLY